VEYPLLYDGSSLPRSHSDTSSAKRQNDTDRIMTTIAIMRRWAYLGVKADAGEVPNCSMPDVSLATGHTG